MTTTRIGILPYFPPDPAYAGTQTVSHSAKIRIFSESPPPPTYAAVMPYLVRSLSSSFTFSLSLSLSSFSLSLSRSPCTHEKWQPYYTRQPMLANSRTDTHYWYARAEITLRKCLCAVATRSELTFTGRGGCEERSHTTVVWVYAKFGQGNVR